MKYKNIWYLPLAIFLVSCASTTKLKDIQSLTTNAPALNSPEEKKNYKKV